jgi:hypothetical protein
MMSIFFAIYIPFSSLPQLFFTGKVTYRVEGETINQILKYKVTPYDIYQLNPRQSGLRPNSILLIPNKSGTKV